MRDFRINLIFEGSSEIMRLFIAREAVDHHFKTAFALVDKKSSGKEKWAALGRVGEVLSDVVPDALDRRNSEGRTASSARSRSTCASSSRHTRKLGRAIFHAMVRLGPKLERRQMVLFRAVDIGAELFAMSAACTRAQMLAKQGRRERARPGGSVLPRGAPAHRAHFDNLFGVNDAAIYRVSQQVLKGEYEWLERGIIDAPEPEPSGMAAEQQRVGAAGAGDRRIRDRRGGLMPWQVIVAGPKPRNTLGARVTE